MRTVQSNQASICIQEPCLAIDTSSAAHQVWLLTKHKMYHQAGCPQLQNTYLLEAVQEVCREAAVKLGEIKLFAYHSGPGSLTRLRIGVAAAKSLAYALKKPAVGFPTPFLQVLRAHALDSSLRERKIWSAVAWLDQRVCWGAYVYTRAGWSSSKKECVGSRDELASQLLQIPEEEVLLGAVWREVGTGRDLWQSVQTQHAAELELLDFPFGLSECIQQSLKIDCTEWTHDPIYPRAAASTSFSCQ